MSSHTEREIKLRFESADAARDAVRALGATPIRDRRLQDDHVFDWPDGSLREARRLLRVRHEEGGVTLTFKGPPEPGVMKVREEIETSASDASSLCTILERLGLRVSFRYQKVRQEFSSSGVILAIDETPVGTFLEIEGVEVDIHRVAAAMGYSPTDYIVLSYRELFRRERKTLGLEGSNMVFDSLP